MTRTTHNAQLLTRLVLAGVVIVALGAWHVAVASTTNARWGDAKTGLDAIKAAAGVDAEAAAPTSKTLLVFGAIMFVALFSVGLVLVLRTPRQSGAGQLASGRDLQRSVAPTRKTAVTKPFAYVDGQALPLRTEDNGAVGGAPRTGKTMFIVVGLIADAVGAVIATSTKPDVLRLTAGIREQVGTVYVFDPEGVSRWPDKIRWDIVGGCDVPEEAQERADALVGSRDLGDGRNAQFFQEAASTVLRCFLHAAALKPGGSMRDVVKWARDFTDDEPYDLLNRSTSVPGWESDLRKFCRGEARETVSSTDMSLGLVLKSFALPSVLDAVCPPSGRGFQARDFHRTKDTLYLMSRSGKISIAAPIITALVTSIERSARLAAGHTPTGRLDPALTLVLDEVANVAPVRGLDSLMSDGGGRGVITWVFVQSRGQLAERYGPHDAKTILDSASVFMMLSGSKDFDHLKELSDLAGTKRVERISHSAQTGANSGSAGSTQYSYEKEALVAPEQIRTMGVGKAFLFYRDSAPAIADLVPWWERRDKSAFEDSMRWVLKREGFDETSITTEDTIREVYSEVDEAIAS